MKPHDWRHLVSHSAESLLPGPFNAHFNRAFRCIALPNLGRCCYENTRSTVRRASSPFSTTPPHGQRPRWLRAWEPVHKTAKIPVHSKRRESVLSLIGFGSDRSRNSASSWQGSVCAARGCAMSMLSKLCPVIRVSQPLRFACPRCSAPNQQVPGSSCSRDSLQ